MIINLVCGVRALLTVVSSSAFAFVLRRRAAAVGRARLLLATNSSSDISQAGNAREREEGRELFELIFDPAKEAPSVLLLLALARAGSRRFG